MNQLAVGRTKSESGEIVRSRGEVSLCFLINQRTQSMRVIDFRAGSQPEKFALVKEVAQSEGIHRIITVVEREEATTWSKMGFDKEGSIPGFYKRSDAHILSLVVEPPAPRESTTRIKISADTSLDDRAERTYLAARRMVKAQGGVLPKVKLSEARPQDQHKAIEHARSLGRDLTDFSSFGRDSEQAYYLCTARGGFSLLVGVEAQPCFDNAHIELLSGPRGEKETWMMAGGLSQLCDKLKADGVVSLFATTPSDSVEMSAIMVAAGFRRTGRLRDHLMVGGVRTSANLWSRKLAEPI